MKTTKRTTEFKVRALELYFKGANPKEAFAQACKEFNTTPSGCMTDYSTSYMYDYKVWAKKQISDKNEYVIKLLKEKGIDEKIIFR